jgi:proline dehydrogenase
MLLSLSKWKGLQKLITKMPVANKVAYRFVAGEDLDDAIDATRELERSGITGILDYLGENVDSERGAEAAAGEYTKALDAISEGGVDSHISVKLTQLGLDLSRDAALARMTKICSRAEELRTVVAIDMEGSEYTEQTVETYKELHKSFDNVVLCLQAYLKRTESDIRSMASAGPKIRLCKGAYDEPRSIAFGKKDTERNFISLLRKLLKTARYTAIATHDRDLIKQAASIIREARIPADRYEFQMLYGVRRELQETLVRAGHRVRIYIPYGDEWYPYLMRRMAERPANLRLFFRAVAGK